jgi:hypothetical protein
MVRRSSHAASVAGGSKRKCVFVSGVIVFRLSCCGTAAPATAAKKKKAAMIVTNLCPQIADMQVRNFTTR